MRRGCVVYEACIRRVNPIFLQIRGIQDKQEVPPEQNHNNQHLMNYSVYVYLLTTIAMLPWSGSYARRCTVRVTQISMILLR